ncbi:hypothetical protein ACW9HO_37895 [Nocardia gipuzkoensis]
MIAIFQKFIVMIRSDIIGHVPDHYWIGSARKSGAGEHSRCGASITPVDSSETVGSAVQMPMPRSWVE